MTRTLSKKEQKTFIGNREFILRELQELQADFEDLSDDELIDCRDAMHVRVNNLLKAALEEDADNVP